MRSKPGAWRFDELQARQRRRGRIRGVCAQDASGAAAPGRQRRRSGRRPRGRLRPRDLRRGALDRDGDRAQGRHHRALAAGGGMSLSDLVLSIADNKQMLGLRYAEWATRAPSLEADIAAAAMGLDDLGHSRVLYGCLEPLGEDPRGTHRESDPASLRALPYFDEPWTEWGQFVAANAILDTAFTVMIEACVNGSVEVLQHRLRQMLMEERYHFLHGRSWLKSGIRAEPLRQAWQEAIEWFGPPDGETAQLHKDGRLSLGPKELGARLQERLETKAPDTKIDWKKWDPVRRRGRSGAIDERTFAMLRGLEEKRFAAQSKEA